ncbi:hypothetical protein PG999_008763 [Apiospora kogelbergensis]|uniref:DUF6546 domain-containing protein n=1 Tax=Apiospora kogelbergensis TaxID=1337665 RepID=A0AAW0QP72_9PEZI
MTRTVIVQSEEKDSVGHCHYQLEWNLLPMDIQELVLDQLHYGVSSGSLSTSYAKLASVCREWQLRFEPLAFRHLDLESSTLGDFEKYIKRVENRRSYINGITFQVKLNTYRKYLRLRRETQKDRFDNNVVFTKQVTRLFQTLGRMYSGYDFTRQRYNHGMELELVVSCDSDSDPGGTTVYVNRFYNSRIDWHMDTYESEQGACVALPLLPMFDKFIMSRQSHRIINPRTLSLILSYLPQIKVVVLEPWLNPFDEEEDWIQLVEALPSHVYRISACEVFSSYRCDVPMDKSDWHVRRRPALAKVLIDSTVHLENVSLLNLIDARHFFADFWPGSQSRRCGGGVATLPELPRWDNLQLLTLTANWCRPDGTIDDVTDNILLAAARAVLRMPRLQMLQIYTEGAGSINYQPALLCYEAHDAHTTLFCATAWSTDVSRHVVRAWETVADHNTRHELRFVHEGASAWLATRIKCAADMHLLLKRGREIIDPESHKEFEWFGLKDESEIEWFGLPDES